MSIFVRNWRDQEPYVGHISALVWTLYQSHDKDETSPPDVNRLHGINSFVKHGLQGHQHSDHHQHDSIEQLYFILRGRGQLTIGDDKVDVRDGTAVYMPVNVPHQAFNDGEGWMEHLIVSCPLDEIREGTPAVRDWRDVHPVVLEGGTISWPLLLREGEVPAGEGGVLQRVHGVTRYAVQGRQGTAWRQLDGVELVHYVLSGYGTIEDLDGNRQLVTEGSAAHVLPGVAHRFANQAEGWLEYVTFAVEVGEVEMPLESDEEAEAVEVDGQYGVEEAVAAAVVAEAEVGLDDADAVETEDEEIEDAATADADTMETEEEIEDAAEAEVLEEDVDVETDEEVDDSGGIESEVEEAEEEFGNGGEGESEVAGAEEGIATAEEEIVAEEEQEGGGEAEVDDDGEIAGDAEVDGDEDASEEGYDDDGKDDAEEDEEGKDEGDGGGDVEDEQITGEVEDVGEVVEDTDAGEEIETDEEAEEEEESEVEDLDEDLDGDEEEEDDAADADEDGVDDEGELDQGAAGPADAEDESSAEDDDFDLEDDDADFDIEDDDEPAVEDETGEEDDDSPDADRR